MNTRHAEIRSQQRGIPKFVDHMLDLYGEEEYDGCGAVILYLSKDSFRRIEQDMGKQLVCFLGTRWGKAYKVKSCRDGCTITTGHRTARIQRK